MTRLNALIRQRQGQPAGVLRTAGLVLNEDRRSVPGRTGRSFGSPASSSGSCAISVFHPGEILSKDRLTERVHDFESDTDGNVIEVYIDRLRQKLGKKRIATYVFGLSPGRT